MAVLGGVVSTIGPTDTWIRLVFIAAFVWLGVGAWIVVGKQTAQAAESESELRRQIKDLEIATTEAARLQALTSDLQHQLLEMSRLNTDLAKEGIAAATGGDSFCWMMMSQPNGTIPVFVHSGKYTLYDVSVRVADLNKMRMNVMPFDVLQMSLGEMHPGMAIPYASLRLPFSDGTTQDFKVFFTGRNGSWHEFLRLRRVGDHWSWAIQVWRFNPSDPPKLPLYEQVSDDFPRNENGLVDWGA
jgi:hypothetical protein